MKLYSEGPPLPHFRDNWPHRSFLEQMRPYAWGLPSRENLSSKKKKQEISAQNPEKTEMFLPQDQDTSETTINSLPGEIIVYENRGSHPEVPVDLEPSVEITLRKVS